MLYLNLVYGVPGIYHTVKSEWLSFRSLRKLIREMIAAYEGTSTLLDFFLSFKPHDYHLLLTSLEQLDI